MDVKIHLQPDYYGIVAIKMLIFPVLFYLDTGVINIGRNPYDHEHSHIHGRKSP